jgi:hypothetical protein
MEPEEIVNCLVMADKQYMTAGFNGRYVCKNRMDGSSVLYYVYPKAICNED